LPSKNVRRHRHKLARNTLETKKTRGVETDSFFAKNFLTLKHIATLLSLQTTNPRFQVTSDYLKFVFKTA
jgi:hypothetical protein